MGTISAREPMAGYPFTNPWDISDGTSPEVSTGIPYMYFTDMEMSVIDLKVGKQGRRKVLEFVGGRVSSNPRPFKEEGFASVTELLKNFSTYNFLSYMSTSKVASKPFLELSCCKKLKQQ
jgi:hypothetical protein